MPYSTVERRAPGDIDVVTFFHLPDDNDQATLRQHSPRLFQPETTIEDFGVDAYFVQLNAAVPESLVARSAYWYSLWSHRRDGQWKGYLQIDLSPAEDDAAKAQLDAMLVCERSAMNTRQVRFLQAEQATLATLLAQLPASSVIERQGLEFRKRKVEEALASQDSADRQSAKLRLTFRGKPIAGSYGIFADFGAAAVTAFTEAVAAIGASRNTSIGSRGRLPNRESYRLLITDTASGRPAGLHTILCRGKPSDWAPGFMAYLQFIPEFRSSLLRVASGTSVYAISRKQLAEVVLRLPPPSEQEAIVAVLSDMDAEIAALEQRLDKAQAVKRGMMQQLLTGRIRLVEESETKARVAVAP